MISTLLLLILTFTPPSVDTLIQSFQEARGKSRIEIANRIFAGLDENGITDSLMVFDASVPADSLAWMVYYWCGEEKMADNDFDAGAAIFAKAVEAAERSRSLLAVSDSYAELAYCLTREGKFDQAVAACEKAVDADTRLGDKDRLAISLNTMAYIYHMSRQGPESEKYIRRSLDLARELDDTTKIALRLGTMSDILMSEGRFQEALESATEAFRLDSLTDNTPKMAIRRVQMAAPLFNLEEYDRARELLLQAEPVLAATGNMASLGICENQLGDIACREERWKDAERHFSIAVQIYSHTGERLSESRARYGMYQALRHSDPEAASLELERYAYLNDTIYSENVSRMTAEFDSRYQNAELRSRNALLRQRSRLNAVLGILVLALLALFFVNYYYRSKARIAEQEKRYKILSERFSNLQDELASRRPASIGTGPGASDDTRSWLDAVDGILEDQMKQGALDVKALAASLHVSPRTLSRKFNSAVGLSPVDYILRFRMERACALLSEGRLNVAEVAAACGMDDPAYFSRFFRKMTGMTPTEYQKHSLS